MSQIIKVIREKTTDPSTIQRHIYAAGALEQARTQDNSSLVCSLSDPTLSDELTVNDGEDIKCYHEILSTSCHVDRTVVSYLISSSLIP